MSKTLETNGQTRKTLASQLARIMHGPILGCPDYQTQTFLVIGARQNLSVHYPG